MKKEKIWSVVVVFIILMESALYAQTPQAITEKEKGDVVSLPQEAYNIEKPFLYEVTRGDNLHWLAAKFYGDARQWIMIYHANKDQIHNPNRLQVGQKLWIPAYVQTQQVPQ